jgi:hypothetical protein
MLHIHCIEIRGSHLLQFPWDSGGFVGFKEVSYYVVQNLVRDAKWKENSIHYQAATNGKEWESEGAVCRLVIMESGMKL